MSETIKWTFVIQVLQGSNVSAPYCNDHIDAYDKFDIKLSDIDSQKVYLTPTGDTSNG